MFDLVGELTGLLYFYVAGEMSEEHCSGLNWRETKESHIEVCYWFKFIKCSL